ncbi:hypothetical protein Pla163_11180 [Planctomycetes bacterium Pla163]|uniref:DUF3987 domain-containing protein n=2 Tax=Rohdeia mirabilis TaxID=2528008 RepID=A0A518CXT2_9BACT|nr:hypothetical protein Pla163_11180 [Planctomycetes bacterium Pla163]
MPAMLMLVAAATCVAKKFEVVLRQGWTQSLNLYVLVAMSPGERKTSVMRAVASAITDWERKREVELAPQIKNDKQLLELAEGRLLGAKRRYVSAKTADKRDQALSDVTEAQKELDAVKPTVLPRLRVDDVTPEQLGYVMRDNGGRIALLGSEGGIIDILAGRYDKGGQPNLDLVLKGWDGQEPWLRDRVTTESVRIDSPLLTLGLAIQPDVISSMAGKSAIRGRGLLGRFLFAIPRSRVGRRLAQPEPARDEVMDWWRDRLDALLELPDDRDEQGETVTASIELDEDAQRRLVEFQEELEPLLGEGQLLGDMCDWGGKLVGHVGRIAALLALIDQGAAGAVTVGHVDRAVEIGRFLIPHAQAAFRLLELDPVVEGAKKLIGWITRRKLTAFTAREALDGLPRAMRRMEHVERTIEVLIEFGYIREAEAEAAPATRKGRRPSPAYDVNPLVHSPKVTAITAELESGADSAVIADDLEESANDAEVPS